MYMYMCLYVLYYYIIICLKRGRYQYAGWLYAMLVLLYDEIEVSELSNAALHMKKDNDSTEQ